MDEEGSQGDAGPEAISIHYQRHQSNAGRGQTAAAKPFTVSRESPNLAVAQ